MNNQCDFKILIEPTKCLGHFILQLSKVKDSACEYFATGAIHLQLVFNKKTAVGLFLEVIFEDCIYSWSV